MIVDLSCPIELRSYELLSDDFGNVRAYIRLHNLSDKRIIGYSATILWYNALTRARITENIQVDRCTAEPYGDFKLIHSTENRARVDHVEMYFTGVSYEDLTEWKPGSGDLIEIGEQKLLSGVQLDALKELAGEDAVQYPEIQRDYWRCVCGRINLLSDVACLRCHRDRNLVLKKFNAKSVRREREEAYAPRERVKKQKSAHEKKRARRNILYFLLAALLLAALAIAGFRFGQYGSDLWKKTDPTAPYGVNAGDYFCAYSASNMSSL